MKFNEFKRKIRSLPVFSTSMVGALTPKVGTLKVQLSQWKKKGLIRPLRQGLYVLGREERQVEPPLFYLANQIFVPSYMSLESALAYYGLIPEYVAQATSVTVRKTCRFKNDFDTFTYQHILKSAYSGFESIRQGDFSVLLANPEKAVVDFLYFHQAQFPPFDRDIFTKSYRFQNCEHLNPKRLRKYAEQFGNKKLISVVALFVQEFVS